MSSLPLTPAEAQADADLLAAMLAAQAVAEGTGRSGVGDDDSCSSGSSYPAEILPHSAPELAQMTALWARFKAWLDREGASSSLRLNTPATSHDFYLLQESLAQGDSSFELPASYAASLACHDGQDWESVTGVLGRWYLLDASAVFREWRDQKEMAECGLYSGAKYNDSRKAAAQAHPRINSDYWFNPRWIPIACSRGRNLGGDLICLDMDSPLASQRGQVIMYLTESAERFVLANSFQEWMERIVQDLERGVYRFDSGRGTFVAGQEPADAAAAGQGEAVASSSVAADPSASSAILAIAPPASLPFPTAASSRIGVEAFLYSGLECRDFFIANRTEELVYLQDNDFGLLAVEDDISAIGATGEAKADVKEQQHTYG